MQMILHMIVSLLLIIVALIFTPISFSVHYVIGGFFAVCLLFSSLQFFDKKAIGALVVSRLFNWLTIGNVIAYLWVAKVTWLEENSLFLPIKIVKEYVDLFPWYTALNLAGGFFLIFILIEDNLKEIKAKKAFFTHPFGINLLVLFSSILFVLIVFTIALVSKSAPIIPLLAYLLVQIFLIAGLGKPSFFAEQV